MKGGIFLINNISIIIALSSLFIILLLQVENGSGQLFPEEEAEGGQNYGVGLQQLRHITHLAKPKKSASAGCRVPMKDAVHFVATGGAVTSVRACSAKKPIKLTKALNMEKDLCAPDWEICSIKDKDVQKLSWRREKMPKGCFAFSYGKSKAAGYGSHCQQNLYFDGILCCPKHGTKARHHLHVSQQKSNNENNKFLHDYYNHPNAINRKK